MLLLEVVVTLLSAESLMITGSLKLSNLLPLLNKIVLAIIPEINTLLNRDKKIFMTMLCPPRETALFIIRYCVCVV